MPAALDRFFDDYARLYSDGDVKGVVSLCHCPFLAIRRGEAIHMPDRGAIWTHFAAAIDAYRRAADARKWASHEIDNGHVVRDTWTSYQLLATPDGWRMLSYTNHF